MEDRSGHKDRAARFWISAPGLRVPPSRCSNSQRERNSSKSRKILDRAAPASGPVFPPHSSPWAICAAARARRKILVDRYGQPINSERCWFSVPGLCVPPRSRGDNQKIYIMRKPFRRPAGRFWMSAPGLHVPPPPLSLRPGIIRSAEQPRRQDKCAEDRSGDEGRATYKFSKNWICVPGLHVLPSRRADS